MANSNGFSAEWTPRALGLLRIVSAFMFLMHGAQKLFGFLAQPGAQSPPMFTQGWFGGVIEFFGGLLLLLGLFSRPVAFILSGTMAVAYFQFHAWTAMAKDGFSGFLWPLLNKGELAALYCFVFLFISVAGGGAWSLDHVLRRDRS